MHRVLVLAVVLSIVLFNCSTEATVLRELIEALLDIERGLFDQDGPHNKVQKAIDTLNSADEYLKGVMERMSANMKDENELKKQLMPICTKFLRSTFINHIKNSAKTSILHAKDRVAKTDDKNRPGYCSRLRAVVLDDDNNKNKERLRKETVDLEAFRTKIDEDVKAAYLAYTQLYLLCNENPERDIKDLDSLLITHGKVSMKIMDFDTKCEENKIHIPN